MAFWVVLINILKIVMKARQMLGLLKGLASGKLVTSLVSDFILGEVGKGLAQAGVPVGSFKYFDYARNSVSLVLVELSKDFEKSGIEIKIDDINQRLFEKIDHFQQGLSVFGGVSPQRNQQRGADPVLFQRGEFERVSDDLFVRGAGADLLLKRVYRSGADYFGPLGRGWDHSFNLRLIETDALIVTQLTGNLSQIRFVQHPHFGQVGFDYFTPEPGTHDILEMDGAGSFLLRKPGGATVAFEAAGPRQHRARSISDCAGNQIDFEYNVENRLIGVFGNGRHRFIRFFYGALDRIERIEDHTGRGCDYAYDETGALVRVEQWSEVQGRRFLTAEAYEYQLVGERPRLVRICDERGRVLVDNEYDTRTGSDTLGYVLNQNSEQGPTSFLYEHLQDKASEFLSPGDQPTLRVFETLPNGHVIERIFNEAGNELLRRDDYVDGGRIRTTLVRTRYNEDGAIIARMDGEGGLTQFLFGREQAGFAQWASVPAMLADVTAAKRMGFGNQLAKIERGKAMSELDRASEQDQWVSALPQNNVRADPADAIVKQRFDPATQVLLSASDVRATASPDPLNVESAPPGSPSFNPGHPLAKAHRRFLTTFVHTPTGLLIRTNHPPRSRPAALGGGLLDDIHEETTAWDAHGRPLSRRDPLGRTTYWQYYPNSPVPAEGVKAGFPRRELRPHLDWMLDQNFPDILEVERIGDWVSSSLAIVSALGSAATLRLQLPCQRIEFWRSTDGAGPSDCDSALISVDGANHGLWDQVNAPTYIIEELSPGLHVIEMHAVDGGLSLGRIFGHVAFTFEIDGLGRIVAETNPKGVTTRTSYDRLDRIIERSRGTGTSMTRDRSSYDPDGALDEKAVLWADHSGAKIAGGAITTRYQRNIRREVTLEVTRAADERDRRITRFYHDPLGSLVAVSNGRGSMTRWRIDALGRRVQETRAACTTAQTTTTSGYDRCGRPTWVRDGEGALRLNGVRSSGGIRSGYDARGRLRFKTDSLGNLTVSRYDLSGREMVVQLFERKSNGSYDLVERHEYACDEHGDRIEEMTAIFTQPIAAADPVDASDAAFLSGMTAGVIGLQRTNYELDALGRQTRVVAGPRVTRIDYDPQGRAFDETLPTGRRVFRVFDGTGNKTRAYAFDAQDPGDLVSKIAVFYETYRFDDHDRTIATEDAYANLWSQSHDTLGNIETMIDPLGRRIERRYNAFAQEIERTQGLTDGGVPAVPATILSHYDFCGNLEWTEDALGRRFLFTYDLLDRRTYFRNASYFADSGTSFAYDRCSRLVCLRDRNGLLRKLRYDKAGHVVRTEYDLSGVAVEHKPPPSSSTFVTIDYGSRGEIRRLENDWTVIRQIRDSRTLLLEELVELKPVAGVGSHSWRVAQSFNEVGDLTGLVYPSGRAISFERDPAGRPIGIYNTFTPAEYPGSPLMVGPAVIATFRYSGARFTGGEYPVADVSVRVDYDGRGQPIQRAVADRATGALVWRQQTVLDKARQTIVETAMSDSGDRSRSLRFDALGRLTGYSEEPPAWIDPALLVPQHLAVAASTPAALIAIESRALAPPASNFILDAVGNRLSSQEHGQPALVSAPDADNRYASVGAAVWTYDREGRLLSDGEHQFRYDAEGRIATEQNIASGQPTTTYLRDALGRIAVSRTTGSLEFVAYLDAQTPLAHWNAATLTE
jgi:YD repeat-containing protein